MQNLRMIFSATAFVVMVTLGLITQGTAAPAIVEQAKANCVVGEQADGYLGFVPGKEAGVELQREVRRINLERKAVYAEIARRNNVTVNETAALTAQKLIARAVSGECVRGSDNEWVRKS